MKQQTLSLAQLVRLFELENGDGTCVKKVCIFSLSRCSDSDTGSKEVVKEKSELKKKKKPQHIPKFAGIGMVLFTNCFPPPSVLITICHFISSNPEMLMTFPVPSTFL